jgi:penicillin-binding protein 1C
VSIAQALAQSLNSPAIEVLSRVGVSAFLDHLRKLHITTLTQEADHYGLSLALGS